MEGVEDHGGHHLAPVKRTALKGRGRARMTPRSAARASRRLLADLTGGHLYVLLAYRLHYVLSGQSAASQALWDPLSGKLLPVVN